MSAISESTVYTERDGRLTDPQRWFHCSGCDRTWQDPKNRSGDTVARQHWRECESQPVLEQAVGQGGGEVPQGRAR